MHPSWEAFVFIKTCLNYILLPNWLYYELIRISGSPLEAFKFYQILDYTFQRSSFFEKNCFVAIFIHLKSKTINWSFQGLNLSGFILPNSNFLKRLSLAFFTFTMLWWNMSILWCSFTEKTMLVNRRMAVLPIMRINNSAFKVFEFVLKRNI